MGCCASSLKLKDVQRSLDGSIYASKRSRSGSSASAASGSPNGSCGSATNSNLNSNSSGLGSACSTPQRNRSVWSRRSQATPSRPICDDFAEQPSHLLDRSCGYHTCSSGASTPSKRQLRRTQDMDNSSNSNSCNNSSNTSNSCREAAVGNLEWEMFMMQHEQRIMCKTSSPIGQRRSLGQHDPNSRSYHKWRHYLQSTPVHMLHNVSHIPEAIAGHFCPDDFPAFSDLEEMESAAKRFKVDTDSRGCHSLRGMQHQHQQQLTHTISTDL
ncbi:hypothetical protein KR044_004337 [Drosophila immigrans]|nr:hypothetical protein KR044_004337 [Drosophila immigrans]